MRSYASDFINKDFFLKQSALIRKATPHDIEVIHEIIKAYSVDGVILARSREDIRSSLYCFHVAAIDNEIVGIISYYDYGIHLKEIRSLGVKKSFLRKGIGSALLKKVIEILCNRSRPRIFVLTYTPAFFECNGFTAISKNELPEKIWKDCINCSNIDTCNETALEYRCEGK
jgi:amino-acid N-acetyltransferase